MEQRLSVSAGSVGALSCRGIPRDCACSAGTAVVCPGAGVRDGGKSERAAGFGQGLSTLVMLTSKTRENQSQCTEGLPLGFAVGKELKRQQ